MPCLWFLLEDVLPAASMGIVLPPALSTTPREVALDLRPSRRVSNYQGWRTVHQIILSPDRQALSSS